MTKSPTRVEAFSDGVFAIAITLLILEIKVPHAQQGHGLWAGLLGLWPSYIAFLMSFMVILIMWVNHHELLRMVERVNYPILFANGLLLRPECTPASIAGVRRAYYVGLSVYLLATVVALFQPWLGLLLNVSLWVLWIRLGYRSA